MKISILLRAHIGFDYFVCKRYIIICAVRVWSKRNNIHFASGRLPNCFARPYSSCENGIASFLGHLCVHFSANQGPLVMASNQVMPTYGFFMTLQQSGYLSCTLNGINVADWDNQAICGENRINH